jgi:DNA-binding Xre family transcriptional regulator
MIKVIRFKLAELLKKKECSERSCRDLAKDIGIDHVSLWKMLSGKPYNPSLQMLDRLCEFFRVQPGEILEYRKK